jgi:hypothetical protein
MSRSGTSAVTEMFHRAGFYVGEQDDLMAADESNPRGYFENLRIHDANERILAEAGGSWLEPPQTDRLLAEGDQTIGHLQGLLQQMVREAANRPVVVKDPRIGVLLPVWKPASAGVLHPVVVVRDPVEVAMSVTRRDLTPIPVVIAAWEVHMTGLLAGLRDETVTVVPYAQLLEQPDLPGTVVRQASERLDPALRAAIDPARASGSQVPELRRNRASAEEPGTRLTSFQEDLWRYLAQLQAGTLKLQPPQRFLAPTRAALEAIKGETERIRTLERLRSDLQQVLGQLGAMQATEAELQASQAEVARLSTILDTITTSNSWRLTKPLRSLGTRVRDRRRR